MKKTLFIFLGICVVFGYVIYKNLRLQGWTFSSHEAKENLVEKKDIIATSTPLLFVGDIMLGRYVETLAKRKGNDVFVFASTSEYLKSHTTIGNLEGPIPQNHEPTPINGFSFSFPNTTPSILKSGGIAVVSLANNHMFDKGRAGYEDTKRALDQMGIEHFGGYAPTTADYYETKLGTTTVIVYGITMIATGWDEAQALSATSKLRSEHPDAHLIAFLHWGDEYKTQNIYQRAFARSLIDHGVDAIIGSHPHVIQGIETYEGKPIFYSLGNFIFDQYWHEDTEEGYMVKLNQSDTGLTYEIVPIYSVQSVPSIAEGSKKDEILSSISVQSDEVLQEKILQGYFSIEK